MEDGPSQVGMDDAVSGGISHAELSQRVLTGQVEAQPGGDTPLERQIARLSRAITSLDAEVSSIVERLGPVLGAPHSTDLDVAEPAQESEGQSQVVCNLEHLEHRVVALSRVLRDTRDQVEV